MSCSFITEEGLTNFEEVLKNTEPREFGRLQDQIIFNKWFKWEEARRFEKEKQREALLSNEIFFYGTCVESWGKLAKFYLFPTGKMEDEDTIFVKAKLVLPTETLFENEVQTITWSKGNNTWRMMNGVEVKFPFNLHVSMEKAYALHVARLQCAHYAVCGRKLANQLLLPWDPNVPKLIQSFIGQATAFRMREEDDDNEKKTAE